MTKGKESDDEDLVSFSDIHLVGGRFDRPGLPLESVHELERYNRIVTEVAKALWRKESGKKKLPPGFSDALSLRLRKVNRGSVVPVITRDDAALFPVLDVLDRARDIVDEAFQRIVDGDGIGDDLPDTAQAPLRRLGSSFSDREAMVLRASSKPVRWDQSARRRYLSILDDNFVVQSGPLVGAVRALDSQDSTFKITSPIDGRFILGRFSNSALHADLHEAERPDNNTFVRLDAEYTTTIDGDLVEITDVFDVELFLSVNEPGGRRLVELAALQPGWLDGDQGMSVDLSAIEFARDVLLTLDSQGRDRPRIYPTPDGGVQMEWHASPYRVELTIEPNLSFETFALDSDGSVLGREGRSVSAAVEAVVAALEGVQ